HMLSQSGEKKGKTRILLDAKATRPKIGKHVKNAATGKIGNACFFDLYGFSVKESVSKVRGCNKSFASRS
ncbi:hypothetical protein LCGC14_2130960, partial [marine sediment metagenome]